MLRTRLYDLRLSDLPATVGLCASDVANVASIVNTAQRRLLYCREAGEEGWYGCFAEVAFNVYQSSPYITTPRGIARLELMDVCKRPVQINNQFVEYLRFGSGRLPKLCNRTCGSITESYIRNNAVTFVDMPIGSYIKIYTTVAEDAGSRVLLQGTNTVDSIIYSNDGTNRVSGEFVTLTSTFVISSNQLNSLSGIQKDITKGDIQIFAVDPNDGTETLLLTMEPSEQTASYRRYYLNGLPFNCCPNQDYVQVSAIAKLDFIPVRVDTDYTLIQNIEAIVEEAQSVRYSRIDEVSAKQMAAEKHIQAVRFLNGELTHFEGKNDPALIFAPFGSARLEKVNISML
jgi:hypothetical protein